MASLIIKLQNLFVFDYPCPSVLKKYSLVPQTSLSEWLLFNTNSAIFSAISWLEQVNFQWDDDEVQFVLDQHV
jgi:hypothetical protein